MVAAEQDLDRLGLSDGAVQIQSLQELICGPGSRLAAYDSECLAAVITTLINLLSKDAVKRNLINADLLPRFITLAYPPPSDPSETDSETSDAENAEQNLLQRQKATLKTIYSICALPEFSAVYSLDTELVRRCIDLLRTPNAYEAISGRDEIPLSIAGVILASLTQSEETARALVEKHKINENLSVLLQQANDEDVLYPIISLVSRLALPTPNKAPLFEQGVLVAMRRFLDRDTLPYAQREAIIAVRRIVTGSPLYLSALSAISITHDTDQSAATSELEAVLTLFRRSDDASIKIEIGRLAIEICRILWTMNSGRPEKSETEFIRVVSPRGEEFADAVAFVILHSESPGAKGEGWFGFAMMSVWRVGRALIIKCLSRQDMLAEVKNVVASGSGPGYQNLRLVLAKINDVLVCDETYL